MKVCALTNGQCYKAFFGGNQCDKMVRLLFNLWPFIYNNKNLPDNKNARLGSNVCQILNVPSKGCLRLLKLSLSG